MKIFGFDITRHKKKSIVLPEKSDGGLVLNNKQVYTWVDGAYIKIQDVTDSRQFIRYGYNDLDTVYAPINKKSDALNRIKLELCDREGNKIESHPLLDLLKKPNSRQTWSDIIDQYCGYFYMTGNFYLYTERFDNTSEPTNLYVFPSQYVSVLTDNYSGAIYTPELKGYELELNTTTYPASVEDMIHVTAPSLSYEQDADLYTGMSPMRPLSRKLRLNNGTQTAAIKLLESGGLRGMFTADPATVKEDAPAIPKEMLTNLKDDFNRQYQGIENVGDVMFTSIPLKWQAVGMNLVDMQLFDSEKLTLTSVCNIVNIDPLLLGQKENSSYNNMRTARQDLYLTSCIPFYEKLVEHLNNKLVAMYQDLVRQGAYLKLNYSEIPEIQQYRMEQAKSLQPFKTEYTTNEIREKLTGDGALDDELADLPIYERDNILGRSLVNIPFEDE